VNLPTGWHVYSEQTQPQVFIAEFTRQDQRAAAHLKIAGIDPAGRQHPWFQTPQATVATLLTSGYQLPVQLGQPVQFAQGLYFLTWRSQNPPFVGSSIYSVAEVPGVPGAFVVTLRSAGVQASEWEQYGHVAASVALSVRCSTPLHRSPSTTPTLPASKRGEDHSTYSRWLDREEYHDPVTGKNFWIRPSTDLVHGPEGLGAYTEVGGQYRKLVPGRN
jgi:hypothetical protein